MVVVVVVVVVDDVAVDDVDVFVVFLALGAATLFLSSSSGWRY